MAYRLEDKLVIAISLTALFDLAAADQVYRGKGLPAYRKYMREREGEPLGRGTAFPLVKGLLGINRKARKQLVEVILMSRNDADSGLRIWNSIEHYQLPVERAVFTDGRPVPPYLGAYNCKLYLSTERKDVVAALRARFPAARVYRPPDNNLLDSNEVRIAFDGDAVLFGEESDKVFERQGLKAFQTYEALLEKVPLQEGPLKGFLEGVSRIQRLFPDEKTCPIRTALVTARGGVAASKRPVWTLRAWKIRLDETFYLGGVEKASVLQVLKPHIFFDDRPSNLKPAQRQVHVAEVPSTTTVPRRRRRSRK